MDLTIGYFGVPGGKSAGLTHITAKTPSGDIKPICGTPIHPNSEYQWCCPNWYSINPECKRCQKYKITLDKLWNVITHNIKLKPKPKYSNTIPIL